MALHPGKEQTAKTVLVVDDLPDIRESYRMLLETAGYRVLDAESATDALECLARERVDVVVTDLYMPGRLDGIALIATVAGQSPPRPRLIAVSGSPHLAYRSSLQAAGFVGADITLAKPVPGPDLLNAVRQLAEGGPKR